MIKVVRVICSCGHTHAILPDLIIPYNTYGVFFILRVIAEYLLHRHSIEHLCARFSITHSMLYRWYGLFLEHKSLWLGVLHSAESAPSAFLASVTRELFFLLLLLALYLRPPFLFFSLMPIRRITGRPFSDLPVLFAFHTTRAFYLRSVCFTISLKVVIIP